MASLRRHVRYIGYALLFCLWLIIMVLPCAGFGLAARGELEWRRGDYDSDRIWLIQERDERGVGYLSERLLSDDTAADGPVCVRSTVRFFLWEGSAEGQNTQYCQCTDSSKMTVSIACP